MKALLLAAGLGTRLRPMTNVLPKCLAPIGDRPLLEYWFANLFGAGFEKVVVNSHYLSDVVHSYVAGTEWSKDIVLEFEPELLGTAGTIRRHKDFFGKEAFLVAHADNLSLFDPRDLIRRHDSRPRGAVMTMMTFETSAPSTCGIVSLDENAVVANFFEKVADPPGKLANAAVYLLEPEVVTLIDELTNPHPDFSTEVIPALTGKIYTYHNDRFHLDIGTLAAWSEAQTTFPCLRKEVPVIGDSWSQILDRNGGRVRRAIDEIRLGRGSGVAH